MKITASYRSRWHVTMTFLLMLGLFLSLSACSATDKNENLLAVGKTAPGFTATSFDGKQVKLSELQQNGPVVLVFLRGFG